MCIIIMSSVLTCLCDCTAFTRPKATTTRRFKQVREPAPALSWKRSPTLAQMFVKGLTPFCWSVSDPCANSSTPKPNDEFDCSAENTPRNKQQKQKERLMHSVSNTRK